MTNSPPEVAEREAFERWYAQAIDGEHFGVYEDPDEPESWIYLERDVASAWYVWQARASTAAKAETPIVRSGFTDEMMPLADELGAAYNAPTATLRVGESDIREWMLLKHDLPIGEYKLYSSPVEPVAVKEAPAKVYLVCTGEVVDGQETYTRHDATPPLCDFETLFASPASPAEQAATQAEAPKVTEDQSRAAFDSAFPEAGLIKEDVWMTAFRWAWLKFAAPTAPTGAQAEPTDVLLMALAAIRWLVFGESRTQGWDGPPPRISDTVEALRTALAAEPRGVDYGYCDGVCDD